MGETIRSVIKGGYKSFSKLSEREKRQQINAVQYIEKLGSLTGKPIDNLDLFKVFGAGADARTKRVVTSKSQINKRFFNLIEMKDHKKVIKKSPGTSEAEVTFPDETSKLTDKNQEEIEKFLNDNQIDNSSIDYRLIGTACAESRKKMEEADSLLRTARQEKLKQLKSHISPIIEQIKDIESNGFWVFERFNDGCVEMITKTDVILTFKKPSLKVDLRVNMGRFKACYNIIDKPKTPAQSHSEFNQSLITVHPYKNNLHNVDDYYHPHVDSNGIVCWGNGSANAVDAIVHYNLIFVFSLLAAILKNYNDDNPYVGLDEFQSLRPKDRPPGAAIRKYCSYCEQMSLNEKGECINGCDDE